jgi:hypothetical protein
MLTIGNYRYYQFFLSLILKLHLKQFSHHRVLRYFGKYTIYWYCKFGNTRQLNQARQIQCLLPHHFDADPERENDAASASTSVL